MSRGKLKTVSERKPPGEISDAPFAAENFSPARGLKCRDRNKFPQAGTGIRETELE